MQRNLITFFVVFILCGCAEGQLHQETKIASTAAPTRTATSTLTPTARYTPTYTPVPLIKVSDLPSGEYLVGFDDSTFSMDEYRIYLGVYSPKGQFMGYMAEVNNLPARLSPNLKLLLDIPQILDLSTGERETFGALNNCGQASWSPDSKYLVMSCPVVDATGPNITEDLYDLSNYPHIIDSLFVFSLEDHTLLRIADNSDPIALGVSSWSPDGKWIAYLEDVQIVGKASDHDGLRILDTRCFSSPSTCWQDAVAEFIRGPLVWSPDSHYLAGIYNRYENGSDVDEVRVFKVENGVATLFRKYPLGSMITWIAWSPSGDKIAVADYDGNFLLSVDSGELEPLDMRAFYYWISVP